MTASSLSGRKVLLIVGGGIAAYKALELTRLLKKAGAEVMSLLTAAGAEFVTPMSLAALTGHPVRQDLFMPEDETAMGHIELSRWADLVVVAPATAGLIAKAANGMADDLASTTLLATDKKVLLAPAMNVRMWLHPAVQANVERLKGFDGFHGVAVVGPDEGEMACGEFGPGRMAEPAVIFNEIARLLAGPDGRPLTGKTAVVTAGPTFEPIDPVRGLTNRSSGKQGYAVAAALAELGAEVTLISGPVALDAPVGVNPRLGRGRDRDEGRRGGRSSSRHRRDERRRGRLARGRRRLRQDQEEAGRAAVAGPDREPRHPGGGFGPRTEAPETGGRFRRRNQRPGGQRPGQAVAEGLRLDRRQRRVRRGLRF